MRDITKCNKSQYIDIHSSSGAPISLRICSLRLFCALAFVCNIYYWILNMDRYWLQLIILTLPSHFKEHYCLKFSNDKIKVTHFVLNVAPLKSSLKLKSWGKLLSLARPHEAEKARCQCCMFCSARGRWHSPDLLPLTQQLPSALQWAVTSSYQAITGVFLMLLWQGFSLTPTPCPESCELDCK